MTDSWLLPDADRMREQLAVRRRRHHVSGGFVWGQFAVSPPSVSKQTVVCLVAEPHHGSRLLRGNSPRADSSRQGFCKSPQRGTPGIFGAVSRERATPHRFEFRAAFALARVTPQFPAGQPHGALQVPDQGTVVG